MIAADFRLALMPAFLATAWRSLRGNASSPSWLYTSAILWPVIIGGRLFTCPEFLHEAQEKQDRAARTK